MMSYIPTFAMSGLGGASGLFGPDQGGAYSDYQDRLNQIGQMYDPYVQAGERGLKGYGITSGLNVLDPTGPENRMAGSFTNSNYQNQIMQNTTNQMNANAANQGMLNSTAQQSALQNSLASQQNQWQQQYINRGTQQYNQGVSGLGNISQMGLGALGQQTALYQEGALGGLESDLSPSRWDQAFTGASGGAFSGLAMRGMGKLL